ncbi:Protein of unknown function [Bacillus mycoides]|nr:Protein of unknown function [Bacillus mycoides]
MKKEDCR